VTPPRRHTLARRTTRPRGLTAPALAATAASLAAAALAPRAARALTLAQITAHGYILVDEPGAARPYNGRAPVGNDAAMYQLTADATAAIAATPGAPRGDLLAVLQLQYESSTFGLYYWLANRVRGLGIHDPQGSGDEIFDLNATVHTAFPLAGFVFLNNIQYYISGALQDFGRRALCPQEFGHRYGMALRAPARAADPDAGVPVAVGPTAFLGRQGLHWSYFANTGGSPMEGNLWEETSPGQFHTRPPTGLFSPVDLYNMGLIPASEVPPFWLIAAPDTLGQLDIRNQEITNVSPTEITGRDVGIRGQRVTYTVDDIVQVNGPRVPGYRAPDGGTDDAGPDGGAPAEPDPRAQRVVWVLLATAGDLTPSVGALFDRAIEGCSDGYANATAGRAQLVSEVAPRPDGGMPDAETIATDAGVDAGAADASADTGRGGESGCGCRTAGHAQGQSACAGVASAAVAVVLARRRRRRRRCRRGPREARADQKFSV
jgi:hypothetical protein